MFWIMIYLLLFGGSSTPELTVPDEMFFLEAVKDKERLAKVVEIREELVSLESELAYLIKTRDKELAELSEQYEMDSNQLRTHFDNLEFARIESQSKFLDQRFMLKNHMNRSEWEKVYGRR